MLGWLSATVVALATLAPPAAFAADAPPAKESVPEASAADAPNGFGLTGLIVPRDQIIAAGPPRDAIPRVDAPVFSPLDGARKWVAPQNPVIGLALEGDVRAYPIHLIEHHQIVNDVVGGVRLVVTFDPLTSAPIAYRSDLGERQLRFGFSGLLHLGGALLYDLETESLWSQFTGRALAGPLAGRQLTRVRVRQEPMGLWVDRHPETLVLERPLLKQIDYRHSPYTEYWISEKFPPVPEDRIDRSYHPKEVVLGLDVGGRTRAYLGSALTAAGGRVADEFAGHELKISYDGESATFLWEIPEAVQVTDAYWFAWKAFHPETEVWEMQGAATP